MKRKVNRVGTNTLTVSLPSKWASKYGVKAGDEVEVEEKKASVIISIHHVAQQPKKMELTIEKDNKRLIRGYLYSAYKNNFDEILVKYTTPGIFANLNKEVGELIGFEIISHKDGLCQIKNVASPHHDALTDLVNKIFLITISFAEDILNAFRKKDLKSLTIIETQEVTLNRLILASQRILLSKNDASTTHTHLWYQILSELEAIGDDLKYICQHYQDKKINLEKQSEVLFSGFIDSLRQTYLFYLKFDLQKLTERINHREIMFRSRNKLLEDCKTDQLVMASYLISAYLKVFDILRDIFQMNVPDQLSNIN